MGFGVRVGVRVGHSVVKATNMAVQSQKASIPLVARRWLPTAVGLGCIPLVIHPIDHFVPVGCIVVNLGAMYDGGQRIESAMGKKEEANNGAGRRRRSKASCVKKLENFKMSSVCFF